MSGTVFGMKQVVEAFFASLASKTLNSSTPTSALAAAGMGSKVIPAGATGPGSIIRVWGAGHYSLGLLGGTATIQVRVNGVPVATVTTSALLNSASNRAFEFIVRLMVREGGLAIASGYASYSTAIGARVIDNIDDPVSTWNFDPSIDNAVDVTVAWDAPTTAKSVVVTQSSINVSTRG